MARTSVAAPCKADEGLAPCCPPRTGNGVDPGSASGSAAREASCQRPRFAGDGRDYRPGGDPAVVGAQDLRQAVVAFELLEDADQACVPSLKGTTA